MAQFASYDTAQQGLLFGYPFQDPPGNDGINSFGETVLDQAQTSHIDNFFQNPDAPMDDAPNNSLNWLEGDEVDAQGHGSGSTTFTPSLQTISNPAVTLASPSNGTYQTHSNQHPHPQSQSHSQSTSGGFGTNVNESSVTAEESAASGLLNIAHGGQQQDSHANSGDFSSNATSWGQLSLHGFMGPMAYNPAINQYNGQHMGGVHNPYWNDPSVLIQNHHPNYALMPGPTSHNFQPPHMQGTSSPQTPHQGHHSFPHGMMWGTDHRFAGERYLPPSSWASIQAEKAGNLNGVPLAAQAAAASHMQYSGADHEQMNKRHSYPQNPSPHYTHLPPPNNLGGLPTSSNQHPGRHYGSMASSSHQNGIGGAHYRPTKTNIRRPSQADEDEEEYSPYGGSKQSGGKRKMKQERDSDDEGNLVITPVRPTPKRRKSNNAAIASSDDESDDGMASDTSSTRKKRAARKSINNRENLTTEEKRQNHIKSEKQRRDLIKLQYDLLDEMVPGLKGGKSGLSRADIMNEICDYTVATGAANDIMAKMLTRMAIAGGGQEHNLDDDAAGDSSGDDAPGV